ncbi:hypothetical protein [Sphingomonas lacusdianchii]|uniref:hypothetical protein n=1 Tax=Sphingomonas lacusdianchii TaxID=2917992 RepID=UPI001F572A80|nr:hypothetical protein [Sphingomonas sp. JXJ CY 53]
MDADLASPGCFVPVSPHDFPLMAAVEALPLRIADAWWTAAPQHGFTAFDFLDGLLGGHAEADIDAPTLLAGGADEQPDSHAASAR